VRRYGIVIALILLVVISQMLYPNFLTSANLQNILSQNATLGIVCAGVTFVTIAAGFDLSVPAMIGIGAVAAARLSDQSLPVILVGVLALGIACGLVNGLIITVMKINPLIATLGTSAVFAGATLLYTHGSPIPVTGDSLEVLQGEWLGLRVQSWIMVAVFVIAGVVLAKTTYGRAIYAIGGSTEAARLAGIRVTVIRTSTYVLSGMCSSLAGVLFASTLMMGQSDLGQANYALLAITVVVVGGTSLFGGEGAMWRSVVGLALLAALSNVFNSLGIQSAWQSIVQGTILILAVGADLLTRRVRG
jgi:ribose transport system permease protein